jgi:hypothetical protein
MDSKVSAFSVLAWKRVRDEVGRRSTIDDCGRLVDVQQLPPPEERLCQFIVSDLGRYGQVE